MFEAAFVFLRALSPTQWLLIAAGVVIAGLLSVIGVQRIEISTAERAVAQCKEARATERGDRERVSREAVENNRELERLWARDHARKQHVYDLEISRLDRARAADRAGHDERLRDAVASFAAGGGATPTEAAAGCGDRAATLGSLLVEGVQLSEELADEAEGNAAAVRALLEPAKPLTSGPVWSSNDFAIEPNYFPAPPHNVKFGATD